MRKILGNKISKFKDDVRGTFAFIFAISLTALLLAVGLAVDFTNYLTVSRVVEASLDSATLAAAIDIDQGGTLDGSARQRAEETFALNLKETPIIDFNAVTGSLKVEEVNGTNEVMATANLQVPAYFGSIFGINTISRQLSVRADFTPDLEEKTEFVFVLDNTGSMARQINNPNGRKNNERINALKSAMLETIDVVLPRDGQNDDLVRVGLVPYATSVNLGERYLDTVNVFSDSVLGNVTNGTRRFLEQVRATNARLDEDQKRFIANNLVHRCVNEREGRNSFKDIAPVQDIERFSQFNRQANRRTFYETDRQIRSQTRFATLPVCPNVAIRPLTNKRQDLINDINAMTPSGYTAGHNGINWGINMLSENWQSFWPEVSQPTDYKDENVRKVLVVMTDGEFNTHLFDNKAGSSSPGSRSARNVAFDSAESFCELAKDRSRGIEIYTVALGPQVEVGNPDTAANLVLRNCASEDVVGETSHFLTASSVSELTAAFKAIVLQEISAPVLTQ